MYRTRADVRSRMVVNKSTEGETIEMKIERITVNKEPIKDGAPLIYTERKDGVLPAYNIKTDRFEVAVETMDKVAKAKIAQRENRMKVVKDENEASKNNEASGTQGTE